MLAESDLVRKEYLQKLKYFIMALSEYFKYDVQI